MEHVKLQLDIKLKKKNFIGLSSSVEFYWVYVTVLDKDDEFEADIQKNKELVYYCNNYYDIRSLWNEPFGALKDNAFVIPCLDKVGYVLKKSFPTDRERYDYVKNMYDSLLEWSNEYKGFEFDTPSSIQIENNIWTVGCNVRNKKVLRNRHRDRLRNNLIF